MTYVLKVRDFDGNGKNLSFQVHRAGCEHAQHADIVDVVRLDSWKLNRGDLPTEGMVTAAAHRIGRDYQAGTAAWMDCAIFGTPT